MSVFVKHSTLSRSDPVLIIAVPVSFTKSIFLEIFPNLRLSFSRRPVGRVKSETNAKRLRVKNDWRIFYQMNIIVAEGIKRLDHFSRVFAFSRKI